MADLVKFRKQTAALAAQAQADRKDQYLAFSLGGETYGMDIRSIREIIQYGGITEVPLMPACIRGVINLRGAVVPVIDISVRFGRGATPVQRRSCVVILELARTSLGFMVDTVNEVLEIGPEDIEPAPSFGSDLRAEFVKGVGKVNGRFVILLDVEHVLSVEEMATLSGGNA